jgi:hypothetical protein
MLSDELLLKILEHMSGDALGRVTGRLSVRAGDTDGSEKAHAAAFWSFDDMAASICAVALTCKKLLPIAQEVLYKAPVLGGHEFEDIEDNTELFLRTLFDRGDLALMVKYLRVRVLVPASVSERYYSYATQVLQEVRNLRGLTIHQSGLTTDEFHTNSHPDQDPFPSIVVQIEPFLRQLKFIRIEGGYPIHVAGLTQFAATNEVDLAVDSSFSLSPITWQSISHRYVNHWTSFHHLQTLRLDCRLVEIGHVKRWYQHMHQLLPNFTGVRHLTFYAETHGDDYDHDSLITAFPQSLGTGEKRTRYYRLIRLAELFKSKSESLELPGGNWATADLEGDYVDVADFETLQVLSLPMAAAVGVDYLSTHENLQELKLTETTEHVSLPAELELLSDNINVVLADHLT